MYQEPEVSEDRHHMSPAELSTLGTIFLNTATVLYDESQSQFRSIMNESEPRLKASRATGFLSRLRKVASIEIIR